MLQLDSKKMPRGYQMGTHKKIKTKLCTHFNSNVCLGAKRKGMVGFYEDTIKSQEKKCVDRFLVCAICSLLFGCFTGLGNGIISIANSVLYTYGSNCSSRF